MSDSVISQNYFKYFVENVNMTVPKSRYVMLALYGDDAKSLGITQQQYSEYEIGKRLKPTIYQI